ncbi:MAG TPA: radical SAM protein [Phycisphaerae bacterium]|jgi:MoaA/NifB/PqqE/SkfB family radical SAM enzyme
MGLVHDLARFVAACRLPDTLSTIVLFVTSKCDAKCGTCFYWQSLNTKGDLTLEELTTFSRSAPKFNSLWLSGGEPLLRKDLLEVLRLFVGNNDVRMINIPTNGMHAERVLPLVEKLLGQFERLMVWCNVSLDGLEATHDRVRGVKGNYRRAVEGMKLLQPLRSQWGGRFRLNVNTVICRDNVDEIMPLAERAVSEFDLDGHFFQVIRGTAMDEGLLNVPQDRLREIYKQVVPLQDHYARRYVQSPSRLKRSVARLAYLGTLTFEHHVQFANITERREWPMPCTAGATSLVIDHDGGIRACELRPPIANLRDYDCDFAKMWSALARRAEVEQIRKDRCFCTYVCAIQDSLRHSPATMFYQIPRAFLTRPRSG